MKKYEKALKVIGRYSVSEQISGKIFVRTFITIVKSTKV